MGCSVLPSYLSPNFSNMADPPDRTISAGPISCVGNVERMALSDLSPGEDISRILTIFQKHSTLQPSVQLMDGWLEGWMEG
jgi:hypothetical protein